MDLAELSLAELKELFAKLPDVISQREKVERAAARRELEAFAAERGFALSELLGDASNKAKKEKKEKGTVAVKYRHPSNPELTSTGRGRTAKWIEEYLANGGTLEQLAV